MDEEIELYLADDEEDELLRNRSFVRRLPRRPRRRGPSQSIVVRPRPTAPVRYPAEPSAPIVSKYTGKLRTGVLIEAAAQAFAALQALPPPPPPASGDTATDHNNLVAYQTALAQVAKKNEQIRTLGRLAHIFMK